MPRLPIPGSDAGNWGKILNDYLSQAHNPDGSLKPTAIQNDAITEPKLDPSVRSKLNSGGGTQGATGPAGPQGPQGPQGTNGTNGQPGATGAVGATGAQGTAGTPGTPGQPGATGASGTPGTPGATGPAGSPGVAGPTGPIGPGGSIGATGPTGSQGATGPQGPAGSDGADSTVPGPQGATGPRGDDGTSVTITGSVANAAALPTGLTPADAGKGYLTNDDGHLHVWSGTAFTDVGTVRGPQGPTGPQGTQGNPGTAGTQGATGAQGPAGTSGVTGAQGTPGQAGATGPMGATGPAGATTIGGISGLQTALDGKVTTNVTMSTIPSGSQFSRNITYTLATDNPDIAQIAINGIVKYWHNEWGAIRGTSPYNWGDSLVRAIRSTGDGISDGTGSAGSGRALEVVDRRITSPPNITTSEHLTPSNVMWGVRWKDGRMVQGGNMVGSVYVLDATQSASDIPATLPAGTLIVRKRAS